MNRLDIKKKKNPCIEILLHIVIIFIVSQMTNLQTLPNYKSLQTTILNVIKMAESSQKRAVSFFFSHSVFKRLVLQIVKNKSLYGKGLTVKMGFENKIVMSC